MTLFNVFIIMYDHIIFAYFLLFKLYGLNHFKTELVYELNVYLCTGSAYYSVMSFLYVSCDVLEIDTTYRFRDRLFLPFFNNLAECCTPNTKLSLDISIHCSHGRI